MLIPSGGCWVMTVSIYLSLESGVKVIFFIPSFSTIVLILIIIGIYTFFGEFGGYIFITVLSVLVCENFRIIKGFKRE